MITSKPVRINEHMEIYLRINRRIRPSTRELTRRAIGYLVEAIGDIFVNDMKYRHAEDFQGHLNSKGFSAASINMYTKAARPMFRWAMRRGQIKSDPFQDLPLHRCPKKRIFAYSKDEAIWITEAANTRIWLGRILLALTAGMRRGEVLNLTTNDIDFDRGIVYVAEKKKTPRTWPWIPKDTETRRLPLTKRTADVLTAILLDLPSSQPYILLEPARYRRMMQLQENGQLDKRPRLMTCPQECFSKQFRVIRKFAGLKIGTFHDLRRTAITNWLEAGLKPHEVMVLAGHSDVETTMKYYVAIRDDIVEKAKEAMGDPQRPPQPQTC